MPETLSLPIHAEFPVVIGEQVRLRAEVELTKDLAHALVVLPHEVLAADLVGLREMIKLLIFGGLSQVVRLGLSCPSDVPLAGVGPHNAEASRLQSIYHGVVDVSRL